MSSAEINIVINRPLEEVFAFAVDINRLKEWNPVIQDSWQISGGDTEVGTTYIVKAKVMGRTMEIPSEVVQIELNRRYAYRSSGFPAYLSIKSFEKVKEGTLISERIVMDRRGLLSRLISRLMLPISKRSHAANLEELKKVLELKGQTN